MTTPLVGRYAAETRRHTNIERQLILMTTAPASLRKPAGTVMQAVRQLLEP
jgi:hypothetical protein